MQRSHIESSMVIVKQKIKGKEKLNRKKNCVQKFVFLFQVFFSWHGQSCSNFAKRCIFTTTMLVIFACLVGDENIDNVCGWIDMHFDGMDFLDWVFYLCQELWRERKIGTTWAWPNPISPILLCMWVLSCRVCVLYYIFDYQLNTKSL